MERKEKQTSRLSNTKKLQRRQEELSKFIKTIDGAKVKKTLTLCYDSDNPGYTLGEGHITTTEFNKQLRAEGWDGDWVAKKDLAHEYWKPIKKGWVKATISDKDAIAVTVMGW